jgi:hypothetical protein
MYSMPTSRPSVARSSDVHSCSADSQCPRVGSAHSLWMGRMPNSICRCTARRGRVIEGDGDAGIHRRTHLEVARHTPLVRKRMQHVATAVQRVASNHLGIREPQNIARLLHSTSTHGQRRKHHSSHRAPEAPNAPSSRWHTRASPDTPRRCACDRSRVPWPAMVCTPRSTVAASAQHQAR